MRWSWQNYKESRVFSHNLPPQEPYAGPSWSVPRCRILSGSVHLTQECILQDVLTSFPITRSYLPFIYMCNVDQMLRWPDIRLGNLGIHPGESDAAMTLRWLPSSGEDQLWTSVSICQVKRPWGAAAQREEPGICHQKDQTRVLHWPVWASYSSSLGLGFHVCKWRPIGLYVLTTDRMLCSR